MIADELDLIAVGCSVFDASPHQDPGLPIHGGIVWAIERRPDPETAEIGLVFHTAEPLHRGKRHIRIAHISGRDVQQWSPPSSSSIRYLITQCARQIAEVGKAFSSDAVDALDAMNALTRAL